MRMPRRLSKVHRLGLCVATGVGCVALAAYLVAGVAAALGIVGAAFIAVGLLVDAD